MACCLGSGPFTKCTPRPTSAVIATKLVLLFYLGVVNAGHCFTAKQYPRAVCVLVTFQEAMTY
eukprot:1593081-Amphidinium_carterae.1